MLAAFAAKAALLDLLAQSAAGRYVVTDIRKRKTDAKDLLNTPAVTVYYDSGNFPRNNSGVNGPYQHEAQLRVDMLTAAVSEVDLTPIQNGGTPEAIAAALAAKVDAEALADAKAEEIAGVLFDIIMRPENRNIGLDYDPDRWVSEFSKGKPQTIGAIVILAGYFTLAIRVPEYTSEEIGTPGSVISNRIDLTADKGGEIREGVTVNTPSP
jgi:hypothetical protein